MPDDEDDDARPRLHDVLRELPLLDDLFLGMQAMNVDLVDGTLESWEAELLRETIERERTPIESALTVSAFSQMWVFAVYELLRTWRQRVRDVLNWAERVVVLAGDEERRAAIEAKQQEIAAQGDQALYAELRWRVFEGVDDPARIEELRLALNRTEIAYRAVEAVRLTLAKHELPRRAGVLAYGAGYGRIDMDDGSIYWSIDLGDGEVAVISRRLLADMVRDIGSPNESILPRDVQDAMRGMPFQSYGMHRVVAVLDDGTEHAGVRVLWRTEVVGMHGHERLPFEVGRITAVRLDPEPEEDPEPGAPF